MNTNQRRGRIAAATTSALAVGAIFGVGAFALSASAATPPAPTSTYSVPADEIVNVDEAIDELEAEKAEAARIEAERVAAEQAAAAAAAQAEADRIAAEQAAAAQAEADRIAAEQAAQQPQQQAPQQQAPAPAPAPAPVPQPGGDQQAGECREYNDANECTAYYVP